MSSKTIITCIQSILPLFQTNIKHGLKQTNRTIFTNKYTSTLQKYKAEIQEIKKLRNSQFVYNYQSALDALGGPNEVTLLVGDPHHDLHEHIKAHKIITLQQMCAVFPQKVPLSYRSRETAQIRSKIQQRMGISLEKQPSIKHILITSHNIKMWDEAIQVILDHQPSDVVVQYEHAPNRGNSLERLTMNDFISALATCHQIVYNAPLPKLIDLNRNNRHAEWIIERTRKMHPKNVIVVDEDLVNQREKLVEKGIDVERVDENSQLWF